MKNLKCKKLVVNNKIFFIKNKLLELSDLIKSLDKSLNNILKQIYASVDEHDKEIYFNNLQLIASMIVFYNKQKSNLEERLLEYYAIISNNDKNQRLYFIECWEKELDNYLCEPLEFEFKPINFSGWKELISIYRYVLNEEMFLLLQTLCGIDPIEEKTIVNKKIS